MRTLFAVLGGVLLLGCSATGSIPAVTTQQALTISEGSNAKPLLFKGAAVKLHAGDDVGKEMGGWLCKNRGRISWKDGIDIGDEIQGGFRDAMKQANYPVVGSPDALFEDPSISKAELYVAGLIDIVQADACYPDDDSRDYRHAKGGAYVRVNWQVYDPLVRKVVYQVSTEGSYKTDNTVLTNARGFMALAFDRAASNLAADQGFHDLVMRKQSTAAASAEIKPIEISSAAGPPTGISDARAATVTVINGSGHGSGFIISPDGYVLTNQHVVDQAHDVKVRLASGRSVMAAVLRTDSARDVALIKLSESNLPALNLRLASSPEVADEVFVIGTPLDLALDSTVARGIVSAYRNLQGFKFIQCDITINHGNSGGPLLDKSGAVVGLTDLGLQLEQDEVGTVNLFIPIDDAVQRLKIRFRPVAPDSGHMQ